MQFFTKVISGEEERETYIDTCSIVISKFREIMNKYHNGDHIDAIVNEVWETLDIDDKEEELDIDDKEEESC
jgi:hypothetical protein